MITLTEAAKKQIDTLCDNNDCYGVSLNLKGGGCAGFEYYWGLVKTPADLDKHDEVFKTDNNCSFIVNASSIMFLVGTEVDYVTTIVGSS